MTTYASTKAALDGFMQAFGNTITLEDSCAVPSTFTTTDKARVVRVPAGTKVTELLIDNDDLDSGTTLAHKVGYEAVKSDSTLVADDDYFGASLTYLRGAARTAHQFAPISFDEDVWITVIPSAGPATTAGSIRAIAQGIARGQK